MISPQVAQDKFNTQVYNLQTRICALIDIRLVNDIIRLKEGYKMPVPFDVIVRDIYRDDELAGFRFSEKREIIIENIKNSYEKEGWHVTYGQTGDCRISNPNLELVFSIKNKVEDDES